MTRDAVSAIYVLFVVVAMVADQLEGGGAVAAELRGSSARRAAARRARDDTHRHRTPARPGT